MRIQFRPPSRIWMLIPLCAFALLVWTNAERARRVVTVTNTDSEDAVVDATSPTGYEGGKRWLVVPEHNNRSYQWIAETQQMLAQREWRVRHIDTENAPFGRVVYSASPYRWWLGLIAWVDHTLSGRPPGLSVERAALWADPLLHGLLLVFTTVFVARQFGAFPAALVSVGIATLYPFAGGFLPGAPDDHALTRIFALWSVLPLLAAIRRPEYLETTDPEARLSSREVEARRRQQRLFFMAGVVGGLGMWISPSNHLPVVIGTAIGGMLAALIVARAVKVDPAATRVYAPWRMWTLGGAAMCLAAYLVEFFPAHLDFRLETIHPIHGLAWIGLGELVAFAWRWSESGKKFWKRPQLIALGLAVTTIAALPLAMALSGTRSLFAGDLSASRLTSLPNGAVANNFFSWIASDGFTAPIMATCLPLLLLAPALWLLVRRKTGLQQRSGIALMLGPVMLALPLASYQLTWWNTADALLLALVVAVTAFPRPAIRTTRRRWLWPALAGLVCAPGLIQLLPLPASGENIAFTRLEVEGLIERALAHWIADHAGPGRAVILAPPYRTTSLCFHGGLRGLGTANWENSDGLAATVRIIASTTVDEARELISQHGITHLVLPSWDTDLDVFAGWSLSNPDDAFVMALHHWALPPWLRPLPYQLPEVPGFENQSVAILGVTEDGNRAVATARLAEYFVEMNMIDHAAASVESLQRYPADLGALVALAKIARVRGDADGFAKAFKPLLSSLNAGFDRTLAWDRRVSLAVVLALGERGDLAREQIRRCLQQIDESRIRSLTTGSLYHLMELSRAYELSFSDQKQRDLALRLLPPELRSRL